MQVIDQFAPAWIIENKDRLLKEFSTDQIMALSRALIAELSGEPSFALRDAHYQDLYRFDIKLNAMMAQLLSNRVPMDDLAAVENSQFSPRIVSDEEIEVTDLKRNGYRISNHRLTVDQIKKIEQEISNCLFSNRGTIESKLNGAEIMRDIHNGKIKKYSNGNGDTYWLQDHNQLCQRDFFQKLAFDPYILSVVGKYFGCVPIHVQTNVWFSFPTLEQKDNLSSNAQMFHQDKEFTKFLKVFIYLSDVGMENGPHSYIEASHIDEAHTLGVDLSKRIPDDEIARYYDAERIKTLVGPAGTITFGDTSCVHKGLPLKSGYRVMLQLEYAASLYLSPVMPFGSLSAQALSALPYSAPVARRLTANYDDAARAGFLAQPSMQRNSKSPNILRRWLSRGKRYLLRR